MKSFAIKRIMLGISAAALVAGTIPLAVAQNDTASPAAAASAAKPTKAERKVARKAARKQARAKKNAELKKLEDAGYQPGQNDPNNLQQAQKKAGVGAAASQ